VRFPSGAWPGDRSWQAQRAVRRKVHSDPSFEIEIDQPGAVVKAVVQALKMTQRAPK